MVSTDQSVADVGLDQQDDEQDDDDVGLDQRDDGQEDEGPDDQPYVNKTIIVLFQKSTWMKLRALKSWYSCNTGRTKANSNTFNLKLAF